MITTLILFILLAAINIICWYALWFNAYKKPGSFLKILVAIVVYVLTMHYLLGMRDELFVNKNYIYYTVAVAMFLFYVYIARKAFLRAK